MIRMTTSLPWRRALRHTKAQEGAALQFYANLLWRLPHRPLTSGTPDASLDWFPSVGPRGIPAWFINAVVQMGVYESVDTLLLSIYLLLHLPIGVPVCAVEFTEVQLALRCAVHRPNRSREVSSLHLLAEGLGFKMRSEGRKHRICGCTPAERHEVHRADALAWLLLDRVSFLDIVKWKHFLFDVKPVSEEEEWEEDMLRAVDKVMTKTILDEQWAAEVVRQCRPDPPSNEEDLTAHLMEAASSEMAPVPPSSPTIPSDDRHIAYPWKVRHALDLYLHTLPSQDQSLSFVCLNPDFDSDTDEEYTSSESAQLSMSSSSSGGDVLKGVKENPVKHWAKRLRKRGRKMWWKRTETPAMFTIE